MRTICLIINILGYPCFLEKHIPIRVSVAPKSCIGVMVSFRSSHAAAAMIVIKYSYREVLAPPTWPTPEYHIV